MDNMNKTILFLSTTKRNDLCCVCAYINPEEKRDATAKSDFHWQTLKCRQIIFMYEELIAAPADDNQIQIHMIMSKSFYGTGKVQRFLEKLHMSGYQAQQLTNGIYEACLQYTIIAHIAPEWNQLQNYLLQGRKFLESNEPLHAILLEVEVKDNSIYVVLTPTTVKLHGLTLDELGIPPALSNEFKSKMNTSIHDITMGAKWVHVLPSMKCGRIITISHEIPNSCPFRTYRDLKRHWKNLYGYRLPESNEGIFYCTLSFHPMIPTKYTYPSICLKAAPVQFMARLDERKTVGDFLTDLARKMPNACGNPFKVNGDMGYTIPKSMEQMKENIGTAGTLLELNTGLIPKPIYKPVGQEILSTQNMNHNLSGNTGIHASMQSSCGVSLTTPPANSVGNDPASSTQNNLLRPEIRRSRGPLSEPAARTPELAINKSISGSISAMLESKQEHGSAANNGMSVDRNINLRTVNFMFNRNTLIQTPQNLMAVNMARHSQPFAESAFASNASQLARTPDKNKTEFIESAHGAQPSTSLPGKNRLALANQNISFNPTYTFRGQNPWQTSSQQAPPVNLQTLQQEYRKRYIPAFSIPPVVYAARPTHTKYTVPTKYTPIFAPPAVPCSQSSQQSKSAAAPKTNSKPPYLGNASVRQIHLVTPSIPLLSMQLVSKLPLKPKIPIFERQAGCNTPTSTITKVPASGIEKTNQLPAFGMQLEPKLLLSTPTNKPAASSSQKRTASNSPIVGPGMPNAGAKKPKSRTKVQTDVNVEELARTQTLKKANAVTLLYWLQEKQVPATYRDNRATLISKIKNTLGIKE